MKGMTRRELIAGGAALAAYTVLPRSASAADPVPSDRMVYGGSWERLVGVTGGIPNRTTRSGSVLGTSSTAAQINSALANCPADQYVELAAGTFANLLGGISCTRSNVTLRGQVDANGVPTTILQNSSVTIGNPNGWDAANPGQYTNATVASGATRGSTAIGLSTVSGLSAGRLMWLSCPANSSIGGGGWSLWFGDRPFTQIVKVTGVSGTTVTFTPAINADYLSGAIQASWRAASNTTVRSGVENVSLVNTGSGTTTHYLQFYGTEECWAKNCKTNNVASNTYHCYLYATYRTEIRHCDMSRMSDLTNSTYCILPLHSSGLLIEDNYFHNCPNVMPMMGVSGSAFAYNYVNDLPYNPSNWLSQIVFFHGSHSHYNLFEGNWYASSYNDGGSGSRNNLWFRNRMLGWDATGPKTSNTEPMTLCDNHSNAVMAGNVLGRDGFHTTVLRTFSSADNFPSDCIYNLHTTPNATFGRYGNYTTVNRAMEQLASGSSLLTSYLHSSKPAWFGELPWPWCDPANYAQSNTSTNLPAGYRAVNGKDPAPATTGPAPSPPSNLLLS